MKFVTNQQNQNTILGIYAQQQKSVDFRQNQTQYKKRDN